MSFAKGKLLSIHSLALSDVIESMEDDKYDAYCNGLFTFIESFPEQEKILQNLFATKDYSGFSKKLASFQEMLKKVYAKGLELSCRRLLDELEKQKYGVVEAHLSYLLAEVSALSIDIQMALIDDEGNEDVSGAPRDRAYYESIFREKSILAVDDLSFLLFGLKSILQGTNYKFTGLTSGEAALRFIDKNTPDLFILDIEMPEMNGYDLAKKLRQRGQNAPIIFMTGNASLEHVKKALEVGAADFIVKPIKEEQVLEKIRKQIG